MKKRQTDVYKRQAAALVFQNGDAFFTRLFPVFHHEEGENRAQLFPRIRVFLGYLRLMAGDENPRTCRHGNACHFRNADGRFADNLRVHGTVGAQQDFRELLCCLLYTSRLFFCHDFSHHRTAVDNDVILKF